MAPRRRFLRGALAMVLSSPLLLLAACSGSGPAPGPLGRARCERQAQTQVPALLRPLAYHQCLSTIEARLADERRQREQLARQQQQLIDAAVRRCRQRQPLLQANLSELRAAELQLARLRAASPPPEPAPPPAPLDEGLLQRYTREDAELDRQRHQQALQRWRERFTQRQAWLQAQQSAREEAQLRLDRAALQLRRLQPDLLARGIELEESVARRVLSCDRQAVAAALPDAVAARQTEAQLKAGHLSPATSRSRSQP